MERRDYLSKDFDILKEYFSEPLGEYSLNTDTILRLDKNYYFVQAPFNPQYSEPNYVGVIFKDLEKKIILAGRDSLTIENVMDCLKELEENNSSIVINQEIKKGQLRSQHPFEQRRLKDELEEFEALCEIHYRK